MYLMGRVGSTAFGGRPRVPHRWAGEMTNQGEFPPILAQDERNEMRSCPGSFI
jgi:hypothetical protein